MSRLKFASSVFFRLILVVCVISGAQVLPGATSRASAANIGYLDVEESTLWDYVPGRTRELSIVARNNTGTPLTDVMVSVSYFDAKKVLISTRSTFGFELSTVGPGELLGTGSPAPSSSNVSSYTINYVAGTETTTPANRNFRIDKTTRSSDFNTNGEYQFLAVEFTNLNRATAETVQMDVICTSPFGKYSQGISVQNPYPTLAAGQAGYLSMLVHAPGDPPCTNIQSITLDSVSPPTNDVVIAPSSPQNLRGSAGNGFIDLNWDAPLNNGGALILKYVVTSNSGGDGCTTSVTSCRISSLNNGQRYLFRVTASNGAFTSVQSSSSIPITPVAPPPPPDGTPPSSFMTAPNGPFLISNDIPVGWSASDSQSGVRNTDVFYQYVNAWGGGASPPVFPTAWQNTQQRSSFLRGAWLGYAYCFQSRARDNSGNVSGWSPSKCTTIPFDERSLTRSSGWSRLSASGWLGNTATYTRTKGKYLTTSSSRQVRQVGVVALKCPTCGTLNVYVGTKFVGRISLYKSGASSRSLVSLPRFSSLKSGKVKLVVASSGKLVKVDALAATAF
jgi:hypothetical protein